MQLDIQLTKNFKSIRGLRGVVVTAIRDCLPYAEWQQNGESWDPRAIAASWELLNGHQSSLGELGPSAEVSFTIEAANAALFFSQLDEHRGVTYIFAGDVPLGVARLRIRALNPMIAISLAHEPHVQPEVEDSGPANDPSNIATSEFVETSSWAMVEHPPPPLPTPVLFSGSESSVENTAKHSEEISEPITEKTLSVTANAPFASKRRSFDRLSTATDTNAVATSAPTTSSTTSSASSTTVSVPSMGSKLLAYLDRYAPDTHAALLRVSLQTGLPVTLLRQPDNLSADEFSQVSESVRNILGVEQLNL